jgi:peptidoglycan hydrolase CwlO-like protein
MSKFRRVSEREAQSTLRQERLARLQKLKDEHVDTIAFAAERRANLEKWIAEKQASIDEMRAEIDELPVTVALAQSRLAATEREIATLKAHIRNRSQLQTLKQRRAKAEQIIKERLAEVRAAEKQQS